MSDLIGLMRKSIQFRTNVGAAQGAGGKDNYSTLLTTRGYLEKSSGSRGLFAAEITQDSSWKLTVRYQSALWAAVAPSLKCIIDGVTYQVESWKKIDEDRGYIEFRINRKDE